MAKKFRGKRNNLRMVKTPKQVIYSVERTLVNTVAKITTDTGRYNSFRLVDYPSVSEFTSLFQFYRIKRVQVRYMLVSAPNNNATFPTLYIGPQAFSTTGVPFSREEVLQYQGVKTFQFGPANLVKTISCVPFVTRDIGNQVGGGELVHSPWLSTANASIQHIAFVDWISRYNSVADSTHTIDIEYKIWIDCKRTK